MSKAPKPRVHESWEAISSWYGSHDSGTGSSPRGGFSKTTAWLPTDFFVRKASKVVALSYINNVHPETQGKLHNSLCDLLGHFIPLFSRCLSDLRQNSHWKVLLKQESQLDERTRPIDEKTKEPITDWDDEINDADPRWKAWLSTDPYIDPVPEPFQPSERVLGTGLTLKGHKLQVIVKIAEM